MPRPPRLQFAGALYHVTSRGDRREPIFVDDLDRVGLLNVAQLGFERHDAAVLAYCLMGNHYHLVVQTRQANLSALMRHINGVYTQRFNFRHGQVGHLFQGRFKAILVDRQNYLLEVCRYVELNPVRAGLVRQPGDWSWSSYRANTGIANPPDWLDRRTLWDAVLGEDSSKSPQLAAKAARRYTELVRSAPDLRLWDTALREQVYLGDDDFVARMKGGAFASVPSAIADATSPERRQQAPRAAANKKTLDEWLAICATRDEAFWRCCRESRWTMTRIAAQSGISVQQVSRLIARWEAAGGR